MCKQNVKYIIGFLLWLFTGSCVEPYLPPPIDAPNGLLVVDGYMNSGAGQSIILLSRTQNLGETSPPRPEEQAQVFFEGDKGSQYRLSEKEKGTYMLANTNFSNLENYRLKITTADNKEYVSEYVAVKATPAIDSISWKTEPGGLQLYVNTHDAENNTWYYRWSFEETWQYTSAFESVYDLVNGQLVPRNQDIYRCWRTEPSTNIIIGASTRLTQDVIREFPLQFLPSDSEKLGIRYSILVRQYALSKQAYEYLQKLEKNTENLGTLFDPQPSQLTGNIRSVSDPQEVVIGYFDVLSEQQQRIFIGKQQLPDWTVTTPYQACINDTVDIETPLRPDEQPRIPNGYMFIERRRYIKVFDDMGNIINRPTIGAVISTVECVDCRTRGTNTKPDFWK